MTKNLLSVDSAVWPGAAENAGTGSCTDRLQAISPTILRLNAANCLNLHEAFSLEAPDQKVSATS